MKLETTKRKDWGGDLERLIRAALKKHPDLHLQKRDPGVAGGRHVGGGMVVGRSRGSAGLDFEGDIAAEPWPCPVRLEAKAVNGRRLAVSAFQPGQLERLHRSHELGRIAVVLVGTHDKAAWTGAWLVEAWALPHPHRMNQPVSVVIGGEGDAMSAWIPLVGLGPKVPTPTHAQDLFGEHTPHALTLRDALFVLKDRRTI